MLFFNETKHDGITSFMDFMWDSTIFDVITYETIFLISGQPSVAYNHQLTMSRSEVLVPGSMSLDGLLTTAHPLGNDSIENILHPYWNQFDIENTIPDSWHYAVAAWMTFFGILGVSGNLLVIWTFLK